MDGRMKRSIYRASVLILLAAVAVSLAGCGRGPSVHGTYVDPVASHELELRRNGTFDMEIIRGMGGTGRHEVKGNIITFRFTDGTLIKGQIENSTIILELPAIVWVKRTVRPPHPRDMVGRYVKEARPDEFLELKGDGTYEKRERLMSGHMATTSGRWELDGHVVRFFLEDFESRPYSAVATGKRIYSGNLFRMEAWVKR